MGRVVGNKCQHEIVQAFGVYATAFDPEAHLHLIGDPSDRFYVAELHDLAKQMGVDSRLHVWGKTSQEELVHRYRTSGLYVSLSEHEGFGVPLLEAMAAGLPVVAFASTAVPETMGGAGIQVHDKDPWFVAGLAKTIADDEGLRERIVARQAERIAQLGVFDVDAVVERAIRLALGEKQPLRVQVQGPFETSYSLATLNPSSHWHSTAPAASTSRSTRRRAPATTRPGHRTCGSTWQAARLYAGAAVIPYPDVTIRQMYPPRGRGSRRGPAFQYFGWEESRCSRSYVRAVQPASRRHRHDVRRTCAQLLVDSGVTVPIAVRRRGRASRTSRGRRCRASGARRCGSSGS